MGIKKLTNIFRGVVYPKFYYCRGKKSDRDWILSRMSVVPKDKQKEVAEQYESLYMCADNQSRKRANTWLDGIAREYSGH